MRHLWQIWFLYFNILIGHTEKEENVTQKLDFELVCGHDNFTYFSLLLERNGIWNDVVTSFVGNIIENFLSCRSTAPPQTNRKVSRSSLSNHFIHYLLHGGCTLPTWNMMWLCLKPVGFLNLWYPETIGADKEFKIG